MLANPAIGDMICERLLIWVSVARHLRFTIRLPSEFLAQRTKRCAAWTGRDRQQTARRVRESRKVSFRIEGIPYDHKKNCEMAKITQSGGAHQKASELSGRASRA